MTKKGTISEQKKMRQRACRKYRPADIFEKKAGFSLRCQLCKYLPHFQRGKFKCTH
jgi:hypothetical protein